jgi:hypothetical protein
MQSFDEEVRNNKNQKKKRNKGYPYKKKRPMKGGKDNNGERISDS